MEPLKSYKNIPSQKQLAQKLGVTEAYVSMLLAGKRNAPKILHKLKELLKNHVRAA